VLDVPHACVSIHDGRMLRVEMRSRIGVAATGEVLAVPRFTHALPARKLRNFGHWLVDCLPQVQALAVVEPRARVLLPAGLKMFHHWSLAKVGLTPAQIVEWNGAPRCGERVLIFENDGRASGGRPLSALQLLRRTVGPDAVAPEPGGPRRIYVSRRDARVKRQWVRNEAEIEALFRRRGFEIVSMAQSPLDDQVRLFRNARVVAGVSGAGLTGLLFSPPETQAIVLTSDSLVRWYADQRGARSLWLTGPPRSGQLAALGDSPRFYAHLAAAFGQTCHSFVGPDALPLDRLSTFLDAVLVREGAP
jgi:capsular polysaccharide biosynthesis protein